MLQTLTKHRQKIRLDLIYGYYGSYAFIMLCLLILIIVYWDLPTLDFFKKTDDDWMLLNNPSIINFQWNLSKIKAIFFEFYNGQYSPVNTFYYISIYKVWGLNPVAYHLGNLFLHLINGLLIWKFSAWLLHRSKINHPTAIAKCIALCWLINPLNVEAVVWISASKILMFSFFQLLAMLSLVSFFSKGNKWLYITSIVCFLAGCLSKEQAVMGLPVLFYIIYPYDKKRAVFIALPFIIITVCFLLIGMEASKSVVFESAIEFDDIGILERLLIVFFSFSFYTIKTLYPFNLKVNYQFLSVNDHLGELLFFVPFSIGIVYLMLGWVRKTLPQSLFYMGGIIFLANIFLCLHIIPIHRTTMLANRYMYFPLLGALLLFIPLALKYILPGLGKNIFFLLIILYIIISIVYSSFLVTDFSNFNIKI